MSKDDYPKVLILGHYLGDHTGTTITLKNLFFNWPSNKIAVAANESIEKMLSNKCDNYYILGKKEILIKGFFKYVARLRKSEKYLRSELNYIPNNTYKSTQNKNNHFIYKRIIKPILIRTGLFFKRFDYFISLDLLEWIDSFDPDIIFTMLGDISSMKFALELKEKTNRRFAVYIADDWIHANPYYSWFPKFWISKFEPLFLKVIDKSDIHLAICDKMVNEYEHLYKKKFLAFHNPIDVSKYQKWYYAKKTSNLNGFIITYVGKINKDTIDGLSDMIDAIEIINIHNVILNIYSGSNNIKLISKINKSKYTFLNPYVEHDKIPELLVKSDLLFIPLSFSKLSKRYTRLSMPTKASESMVSRTPIIVYAPREIALTEYAEKKRWAFIINERSIEKLKETVLKIYNKDTSINEFVNNAYSLALKNHSKERVRNRFKNALIANSKINY